MSDTKPKCPICGDPNIYSMWVSPEPPDRCGQPFDDQGREIEVRNVTECQYQMKKAAQRAEWIKLVPDAFDEWGNMKPGELPRVLEVWADARPGQLLRW